MAKAFYAFEVRTKTDNVTIAGTASYETLTDVIELDLNKIIYLEGYREDNFNIHYLQGDFADEASAKADLDTILTVGDDIKEIKTYK